jgi:hypothetical protein
MITHMFWAYGGLSKMERICVNSFIKNGFELNLWTYENEAINIDGVTIRDAREVIPESLLFLNRAGSYAGFSDLFRYSVLCLYGGLWVDTDVVALKPAVRLPDSPFLVTERAENNKIMINGNVIYNPVRRYGNIIDLARVYAERFPKEEILWNEIGPALLTAIVQCNPHHGFTIFGPEFANHVNHWDCPNLFIKDNIDYELSENMHFMHLYNEMWRRARVDKNEEFPQNCLYEKISRTFAML